MSSLIVDPFNGKPIVSPKILKEIAKEIPNEELTLPEELINKPLKEDDIKEVKHEHIKKPSKGRFKLSFIEEYEEEEAKVQVEKHLGFEPPRMSGIHMAVKVYVRGEEVQYYVDPRTGIETAIAIPDEVRAEDKYRSCVALVVSQGPDCYKGKMFEESNFMKTIRLFFGKWMKPSKKVPWCKVGDWVMIPRNEGTQINYRDVPMQMIRDVCIYGTVEDPEFVRRD